MRSNPFLSLVVVVIVGCRDSSDPAMVSAVASRFDAPTASVDVEHPHLPLIPGRTLRYAGSDGQVTTRHVSHFPQSVGGVECRVIVERIFHHGRLVEGSFEYYVQDDAGAVWILGVDRTQYDSGERPIGAEGSWRFDQAGRGPGLVLPGDPQRGESFRRWTPDSALRALVEDTEDRVDLDILGTFEPCLRITEILLGAGVQSRTRYLALGVGEVLIHGGGAGRRLVGLHDDREPVILSHQFGDVVDHPLFPLPPGRRLTFAGVTEDGSVEDMVEVLLPKTRIMGIDCTTVRERTYENGTLFEDVRRWYAQDAEGKVWFFGEEKRFHPEESWRAGVGGAQPGIAMRGMPRVGDSYYTEYIPGMSEDIATVLALSVPVETSLGEMEALEILGEDTLDDEQELEYYARHLGLVIESNIDGTEYSSLVEVADFIPATFAGSGGSTTGE